MSPAAARDGRDRSRWNRAGRAAAAVLALATAACTVVGPDYRRPETPLPPDLPSTAGAVIRGYAVTSDEPWATWWTVFHDPELERLVAAARTGNFDLRAAYARVVAARAIARQAGAAMFPTATGNGAMTGQKPSGRTTSASSSVDPSLLWQGTVDLSYELDLFGRLHRGAEAACMDAFASEEDRRALEIALIADVANAYFDLGAAEAEAAIARESAALLEKTLGLVNARFEAKLVGEIDVRRTEGDLASARALIPDAERKRAVAAHALSLLTGAPPGAAFIGKAPSAFAAPPEVPVGLPASLLVRRPDVRAAERRVMAANARIGEAIAQFYPSITLAGRFGYASTRLGKLPSPAAQLWSIGPSISIPIFQGGLLAAQRLEREAEHDEASATYVHTVLTALSEVADAIVGVSARLEARDRQAEAAGASQRSVDLTSTQYEGGLTGYVNVLDSQRALASARLALLDAQRAVLSELVLLGKALGGGWTP